MHYEGRRVAVSIDAHEQALSLVDQPKGMMKRVFHRRPNRAIELDRITRLGLFGGTQLEVRTAAETLVLECGCAGDGARWLGLLRARCGQAAVETDEKAAPSPTHQQLAPSPSGSEASSVLSDDASPGGRGAGRCRPKVGPIGAARGGFRDLGNGGSGDGASSPLDSSRSASTSAAEELGCLKLNKLIYIGGRPIASDRSALERRKITHVVNMALECDDFFPEDFRYYHARCTDKADDSMAAHFDAIVAFVDDCRERCGRRRGARVMRRHFNMGVLEATPESKASMLWGRPGR